MHVFNPLNYHLIGKFESIICSLMYYAKFELSYSLVMLISSHGLWVLNSVQCSLVFLEKQKIER